uniref:Uncharacterized protein n=1 Tax=Glossina pallidipes TaxID=7398 RepID=A0A1A9Z379_GLOPL
MKGHLCLVNAKILVTLSHLQVRRVTVNASKLREKLESVDAHSLEKFGKQIANDRDDSNFFVCNPLALAFLRFSCEIMKQRFIATNTRLDYPYNAVFGLFRVNTAQISITVFSYPTFQSIVDSSDWGVKLGISESNLVHLSLLS